MRVEIGGHDGICPPHGAGHFRQGRIRKGPRVGEGQLPGRQGLQFAQDHPLPPATGPRMGNVRQDGAHRPRLDGRQSQAGQKWVSARRRTATTPSPPVFKASGNGRTTCPTAISWRRSSTRRSIGTASRTPYIVATENDSLNGAGMLFGYLLTNTAQIFADVRTYWSPAAVKRVTGHKLAGAAAGGFLHLINSGPAALDGNRRTIRRRQTGDETVLGNHRGGSEEMPRRHDLASVHHGVFSRRRLVHPLSHARRNAGHDVPAQSGQGTRPGAANRRRLDHRTAGKSPHDSG